MRRFIGSVDIVSNAAPVPDRKGDALQLRQRI